MLGYKNDSAKLKAFREYLVDSNMALILVKCNFITSFAFN